jgi:hypothetical protein
MLSSYPRPDAFRGPRPAGPPRRPTARPPPRPLPPRPPPFAFEDQTAVSPSVVLLHSAAPQNTALVAALVTALGMRLFHRGLCDTRTHTRAHTHTHRHIHARARQRFDKLAYTSERGMHSRVHRVPPVCVCVFPGPHVSTPPPPPPPAAAGRGSPIRKRRTQAAHGGPGAAGGPRTTRAARAIREPSVNHS